jgi:preprotein translocase subunit SecG
VLTDIIVGVEVASSLSLVLLILLHSGRGGGLSDMFGSSVGTAAAGSTVAEKNLDRLTIAVAVIFAFSTVIIGLRWR